MRNLLIGLVIGVVMLVSIVMFETTSYARWVWTVEPTPTSGGVADVIADGTDIQNGDSLEDALRQAGPLMTTVRVHTGNYSDLGALGKNRFSLHGLTTLEAAGDGPVLIYGSGQGSSFPVLLAAWQVSASGSIIDGKNKMTIRSLDGGRTIHVDQATGITLKNLTVEGGDSQIFVTNYWQDGNIPNNGTLDNVTINSPSGQRAIYFTNWPYTPAIDIAGWTVKNCTINGGDGSYGIWARNLKNSTITNNTFSGTIWDGVALLGNSTGNVLSNNTFTSQDTYAYGITDYWEGASTGNTISDNVIVIPGGSGLGMIVKGNNVISGNDIISGWVGIWADGADQVLQITDNTVEAGWGGLILTTSGATGNVSGNTLLGKTAGTVALSTFGVVTNNINFSYNTIEGFRDLEVGIGAPNPNPPSIFHNTFKGDIRLYQGDMDVYDNLFTGSAWYPPLHWNWGVVTLSNNWFASSVAEVNFASTDPDNEAYLYLSCDTPLDILTDASDGTYYGALPIYPQADCGPGTLVYDTLVDACCDSAKNHGQFVKCVNRGISSIGDAISDGLHGEIISNAAHEKCEK